MRAVSATSTKKTVNVTNPGRSRRSKYHVTAASVPATFNMSALATRDQKTNIAQVASRKPAVRPVARSNRDAPKR